MKDWWLNHSLREQQMMLIGLFSVIIFLLISFVYFPLQNKASVLRTQLVQNQKLLVWMEETDKKLEKWTAKKSVAAQDGSLLTKIQVLLNQSTLNNQLQQMHPNDRDGLELSFKEVDYVALMNWLIKINNTDGLSVTKIALKESKNPGIVTADLILNV